MVVGTQAKMNLDVYKIQYCTVQNVFQRTISIVFSFIKVEIYMNKTLSGCLRELKNKRKVQLGDSKKWLRSLTKAVSYESFSLQSFSHGSNGVSQR